MKVKFDSSVSTSSLGLNKNHTSTFKANGNRSQRKGFVQRVREAAMTIVGSLIPDQWDTMWQWQPVGHRSSFNTWREPRSCTAASATRGGEIEIPIQIVSSHSCPATPRSSLWQEWSDTESDDDLNNSSSAKARRKRRRNHSTAKLIPSNDSLLNTNYVRLIEDDEELKRKEASASSSVSHKDTHRYNTRASGVSSDSVYIVSDSEEKEINDTCSYSVYEYLKAFLGSTGRQIDSIKGDGNCFFRALSKVIYGNQNYYDDVRQAVVDVLEKYPKEFEAFTDGPLAQHIHEMRQDKTWATQVEIYAAATLLNRDIYILSPDQTGKKYRWLLFQPQVKYNKTFTGCRCYITICHTHGNHYDRIAPINGKCNCGLAPPDLTGVKGQVDLTFEDEIV